MSKSIVSSAYNPAFDKFFDNLKTHNDFHTNKKINFFEELLVISADKKDIKDNSDFAIPKVLYSFPDEVNNLRKSWLNVIPQYVFPFGVKLQTINTQNNCKNLKE